MKKFFIDVFGKWLAAMLVAITFSGLGLFFYKTPDINGSWVFWTKYSESDQNLKFRGLNLGFRCLIQQSGEDLRGSGEKIWWREKNGQEGKDEVRKRSRLTIFGHIDKHYFSKDVATIHIDEQGVPPQGNIKTMQIVKLLNDEKMIGTFTTLGWEHSGTVEWTKEKD